MIKGRNKYIGLILILVTFVTAGFMRAHNDLTIAREKAVHSARTPKYKDAVIAHRLHQNHYKGIGSTSTASCRYNRTR